MAESSAISWTDGTFNPWIGCAHAVYRGADGREHMHQGCVNCYAEADMDKRRGRVRWGAEGTRSRTSASYWNGPRRWDRKAKAEGRRMKVFCASLADVFERWDGTIIDHRGATLYTAGNGIYTPLPGDRLRPATLDDLRADLFALIDATPNLDWLLLTKRPGNVAAMWPAVAGKPGELLRENVWLTVSASDQASYDWAVDQLPALRRFARFTCISAEPLLGPLQLNLHGVYPRTLTPGQYLPVHEALDWLILGGESGSERPCQTQWISDCIAEARGTNTKIFVKQLGSHALDADGNRIRSAGSEKNADPLHWPLALRVQEFPDDE